MPSNPAVHRALLAGSVGGLAGALAMDLFQHRVWTPPGGSEEDEITRSAARILARRVFGRGLNRSAEARAGSVLHYLVGIAAGVAYGLAFTRAPIIATGAGVPFGIALWLGADELAAPAIGLAHPRRSPMTKRVNELAAHIVYAATLHAIYSRAG